MTQVSTSESTLVIRRLLPASRADVFAAWTDAHSLGQWMCPPGVTRTTAELDARVGGRYRIVMHGEKKDYDHHGEYLVVDPPSKLSFTWISEGTDLQSSIVTVELFDKGADATELVLTHEQLPPAKVAPHTQGWTEIVERLSRKWSVGSTFKDHAVVSHDEWLAARTAFLTKEKEFTRLGDELNRQRRDLPWEAVQKSYVFEGANGKQTLAELFDGRSQLIVYHFMFHPNGTAGCPHCSLRADGFNGIGAHLNQRDVTMVVVSRAPHSKLAAYQKRMGWTFPWVSSFETDFNVDYCVSFTPEEVAEKRAFYNFKRQDPQASEREGHSVFCKDASGAVFHTYSCYDRGNDKLNLHYHYLDLVPKGRDEGDRGPFWVRRHDEYGHS
jgi:predicted dithiol-disulfide oxidoreductase (DUF899 family)/uncharacterized protein YndB with AHSA1/START domain